MNFSRETLQTWASEIIEWHGHEEEKMVVNLDFVKTKIVMHDGTKYVVQFADPCELTEPLVSVFVSSDFGCIQTEWKSGTWNGVTFNLPEGEVIRDVELYEKINSACAEMAR